MEQHPVPQHIASYEFRLVGDMTLKQFGMLAGCCFLALLFYASHLPAFFKWPLVLFFILLGIGMAFFPIGERPLNQWLVAFFKATYSPTLYIWKKQPPKLEILTTQSKPITKINPASTPPPDEKQLTEYLQSLPEDKSTLDKNEELLLEKVDHLFQVGSTSPQIYIPQPLTSTPLKPLPQIEVKPKTTVPELTDKVIFPGREIPKLTPEKSSLTKTASTETKQELKIARPVLKAKEVKPFTPKEPVIAQTKTTETPITPYLPLPQTPKTPNLLVGMVLDEAGKIIENSIIEIRNSAGIPVRALKTNRLGQFLIVTPLPNDVYEIETEKEGSSFDIIKIELVGRPVPPIEIRAK